MIKSKQLLITSCLFLILCFGSAFVAINDDAQSTIFSQHDYLDCNACHAAWMTGGSGNEADFLALNHAVKVSFFDKYIFNYSDESDNNSGVDINKLTQFIDSI